MDCLLLTNTSKNLNHFKDGGEKKMQSRAGKV